MHPLQPFQTKNYSSLYLRQAEAELELRRRRRARIQLLPHQLPPAGDWHTWIMLSGRGGGKTYAAAHYIDEFARTTPGVRIAIIAPTLGDARGVCVEGETGLLQFNRTIQFNRSWGELTWPNGSKGALFGSHTPEDAERLRGPQHHLCWWDEYAASRHLDDCYHNMEMGLRLGQNPRLLVTTTPKPRKLLTELLTHPTTVVTRATTADNPHLSESVRARLYDRYGGTRLGRQELGGELLEDVQGALWARDNLDLHRVLRAPDLVRIVVSVDPSATAGGNECGITVQGVSADGHGYLLDDLSVQASPHQWAVQAVTAYHKYKADRLVAETNQGGAMIRQTIHTIDPTVNYVGVHASRGKYTRAEPVSALYSQGKCHHIGAFPDLEDELCGWVPGGESPNRLDALVHGFTDLMLSKQVRQITMVGF